MLAIPLKWPGQAQEARSKPLHRDTPILRFPCWLTPSCSFSSLSLLIPMFFLWGLLDQSAHSEEIAEWAYRCISRYNHLTLAKREVLCNSTYWCYQHKFWKKSSDPNETRFTMRTVRGTRRDDIEDYGTFELVRTGNHCWLLNSIKCACTQKLKKKSLAFY